MLVMDSTVSRAILALVLLVLEVPLLACLRLQLVPLALARLGPQLLRAQMQTQLLKVNRLSGAATRVSTITTGVVWLVLPVLIDLMLTSTCLGYYGQPAGGQTDANQSA